MSPVQYHHLYTASSVHASPASSDFTATQTNSNSTLSSTTVKSEGESPSKFSWNGDQRINYINRLDYEFPIWQHLSQRLQRRLNLPHPLYWTHLFIKQVTTQGNYKGTSTIQFNFHFHGAYSFHNLIVNKYILYHSPFSITDYSLSLREDPSDP